jgi:hypothetical protein
MFNQDMHRTTEALGMAAGNGPTAAFDPRRGSPLAILPPLLCLCLLAVSLASVADLHPEGYDQDCAFCQFHKHTLIETAALPSPPLPARVPDGCGLRTNLPDRRGDLCASAGCRAPPEAA